MQAECLMLPLLAIFSPLSSVFQSSPWLKREVMTRPVKSFGSAISTFGYIYIYIAARGSLRDANYSDF